MSARAGGHRGPWALLLGTLCLAASSLGGCAEPVSAAAALVVRANRAYDGAPPTIPHGVEELGRHNCQACHTSGTIVWEGKTAPKTPHPELVRCTQCHLERRADTLFADNDHEPGFYARSLRQHEFAPWRIPHPLTLRENCLACHDQNLDPEWGLRTTHPERSRCTQCHVPAAEDAPGPRPGVALGGAWSQNHGR